MATRLPDPQRALYVLDVTALVFRAYYGPIATRSDGGEAVGALLGTAQMIARFVREVRPRYALAVFDAGARTFRNDLYPAYKANRGEAPEDLSAQLERAPAMLRALGFATVLQPGYEADDLMATAARRAVAAGLQAVLVSGDKDICQLVRDDVWQMDPKTFELADAVDVHGRFGLHPGQLVDLQALTGDSTDNVPGVRGVGPKTAVALLQAMGSLDALLEAPERVAELPVRGAKGVAEKLRAEADTARLCRTLVRLVDDAPCADLEGLTRADLRYAGPPADADAAFAELGFSRPLHALRKITAEWAD